MSIVDPKVKEHLETCVCKDSSVFVCQVTKQAHRWSGWPGAYCLDCNCEDPSEQCITDCKCPCHNEFWKDYEKACEAIAEEAKG